jgi:hypothetical protein
MACLIYPVFIIGDPATAISGEHYNAGTHFVFILEAKS